MTAERTLSVVAAASATTLLALAAAVATLPPCEQEDSPGPCYWNAQERGNRLGSSFIRIGDSIWYL